MFSLEETVKKNSIALWKIMSKEGEINLLDTSIFRGFPREIGIMDVINEGIRNFENDIYPPMDIKSLSLFCKYTANIFDCINLYDQNLIVPEITDKEIPQFIEEYQRKMRQLTILLNRKNIKLENLNKQLRKEKDLNKQGILNEKRDKILKQRENSDEGLDCIKDLYEYLVALKKISSTRNFLFNQDDRNIYEKYTFLVNKAYNMFAEKEVPICADDGLIAGGLYLLQQSGRPINIITNDSDVLDRLRIINSLIYIPRKRRIRSNLYNLLDSNRISVYSTLNEKGVYTCHGTTGFGKLRYNLRKKERDISKSTRENINKYINKFFPNKIKEIIRLENK